MRLSCGRAPVVVKLHPLGAADAADKMAFIASLYSIDILAAAFRAIAHASTLGKQQMVFLVLISVLLRNSYTLRKATKRSMKIRGYGLCGMHHIPPSIGATTREELSAAVERPSTVLS